MLPEEEITQLKRKIELLKELIEEIRPKCHYHVEEDTWYCCSACPDYCGEEEAHCTCRFEYYDRKIERILSIL